MKRVDDLTKIGENLIKSEIVETGNVNKTFYQNRNKISNLKLKNLKRKVKFSVLVNYLKACSLTMLVCYILSYTFMNVGYVGGSLWLSDWTVRFF
jgi:hypothetical protein